MSARHALIIEEVVGRLARRALAQLQEEAHIVPERILLSASQRTLTSVGVTFHKMPGVVIVMALVRGAQAYRSDQAAEPRPPRAASNFRHVITRGASVGPCDAACSQTRPSLFYRPLARFSPAGSLRALSQDT